MRLSVPGTWRWLLAHPKVAGGLALLVFFGLMALIGPMVFPNPNAIGGASLSDLPPSPQHWLGTTLTGQDVFQQTVVGARTSLLLSFGVGLIGTLIAALIGITAGYAGGLIDDLLSLLINVFLVIPALPLAVALSSYFVGAGTTSIFLVLIITAWPYGARVFRAQTLSLRQRDFVQAAKSGGESFWRLIFFEIFPNMVAVVASGFIGVTIFAILADVGLEFIGLGDVTGTGWGTMLYWAQNSDALVQQMWWWFAAPGACVALVGAGLSLLNFGIDEIANPRLRRERILKSKLTQEQQTVTKENVQKAMA